MKRLSEEMIPRPSPNSYVIDTSALIDGRFFELFNSNIFKGKILLPSKVIEELKTFSDSDASKYASQKIGAKRAFNKLKKVLDTSIVDRYENLDADEQIVKIAQKENAQIISQDKALISSARLSKLIAHNLSEVQRQLIPKRSVNDTIKVKVAFKGVKPKQAIGLSEEQEIVLIKNGSKYIGKTIKVSIVSVVNGGAEDYYYEATI